MLIYSLWLLFRYINGICPFLLICHDRCLQHWILHQGCDVSAVGRQSQTWSRQFISFRKLQRVPRKCLPITAQKETATEIIAAAITTASVATVQLYHPVFHSEDCFWRCDVGTVHDHIHNESMTPLSLFSLPGSGINNELWSVKYHPRSSKLRSVTKLSESFCLLLFFWFSSAAMQTK